MPGTHLGRDHRATRVALAAAAVAAGLAPVATAATVALPWPGQRVTGSPPLSPPTVAPFANRFRGRIDAGALVEVVVAPDGVVRSATIEQRLVVRGTGDYLLTVPAPVTAVLPAFGTESEPGLRRNAIVWQGFSPGRRVLVARAVLRPASAAAALPLRVRLERTAGAWRLVLENRTASRVRSFTAAGSAAAVRRYVGLLRGFELDSGASEPPFAEATGIRPLERRVSAAIRVRATAGSTRLDLVLGGGRPDRIVIRLPGAERLDVSVSADPARPRFAAEPTLDAAIRAALSLGLARQYASPLANPDVLGRAAATYRYRVALPGAAPSPVPAEPGGGHLLDAALVAVLALGGAALLALWARS